MKVKNLVKKCPNCGTLFNLSKMETKILNALKNSSNGTTTKQLAKTLKLNNVSYLHPALHSLQKLGTITIKKQKIKHGKTLVIKLKK